MPRPNLIVILIDDLGARDLGCTGSTFYETPRLDRFAAEGVNCAAGYAASPVCSPARAALLTGRAPDRVGVTNWIGGNPVGRLLGAPNLDHLPHSHRTLATALRAGGYHTWHVGKWHLGGDEQRSLPTEHGFEVNLGGNHHGSPGYLQNTYFAPWIGRDGKTVPPGLEHSREGEYLTDRLTDEAIRLIRDQPDDRPFFLHLSHYAVHTPIHAPEPLVAKYRDKAARLGLDQARVLVEGEPLPVLHLHGRRVIRRLAQSHPAYAAMVENLDWNVGRLLDALDEAGLADDTLIVFVSDNGGLATGVEGSPTCNLPLAEGKGWTEEGGLRVPFLWRWPARLPASRVCHQPIWQCDIYPTFLSAAGLAPEPDHHVDGLDVLSALTADQPLPREELCWHYPHYPNQGATPSTAIRHGEWKLIEWFETGRTALYHLPSDPSERWDRAAEHPDLAADLQRRLALRREAVGSPMPTPNPDYEAMAAGRMPRPDGAGRVKAG